MARHVLGGRTSRARRKQSRRTIARASAARAAEARRCQAPPSVVAPEAIAAALEAQRKAIARELHDGVAQDLAYLAGQLCRLSPRPGQERLLDNLQAAAQRALLELRMAVDGLRDDAQAPLAELAERTIATFEARCGVVVERDIATAVAPEPPPERRAAIVRILGEALTNAAAHGAARRVRVELRGDEGCGLTLRVADDGAGFDVARSGPGVVGSVAQPPRAASGGTRSACSWGLVSMRERAELLGGRLAVHSQRGAGTEVELVVPSRQALALAAEVAR
jgi:signal transduction histidine kinase